MAETPAMEALHAMSRTRERLRLRYFGARLRHCGGEQADLRRNPATRKIPRCAYTRIAAVLRPITLSGKTPQARAECGV